MKTETYDGGRREMLLTSPSFLPERNSIFSLSSLSLLLIGGFKSFFDVESPLASSLPFLSF